jgi:plastocyanin
MLNMYAMARRSIDETIADEVSRVSRMNRVARWGMTASMLAALVAGASLASAPAANAAPAVVNVSLDCLGPLSVTADVGDTVVFTFASTCNFVPGTNEWNLWNLDAADGSGANAGFLSFVSTTATFTNAATDSCGITYVNCFVPNLYAAPPSRPDWTVTSNTTAGTSVTTILGAVNGSNLAIGPGVALGVLSNDMTGVSTPWAVAILWNGPRSSGAGSQPDMTLWQQSIARASADAGCPSGYTPSWAQWPNDRRGGWVCNRDLFAYQPNPGA